MKPLLLFTLIALSACQITNPKQIYSPDPNAMVVYAENAGGAKYVATSGIVFNEDRHFVGGKLEQTTQ